MKRYLAIFLLTLLPLQFAWAAIAVYCDHKTAVAAEHPSHHSHEHLPADPQETGQNADSSTAMDHDCAVCQLGCAAPLVIDLKTATAAVSDDHPLHHLVMVSQPSAERPERPKWPMLA